jgi:hypothetical protein
MTTKKKIQHGRMMKQNRILFSLCLLLGLTDLAAQGGPPMITDDPGTPGDGHWEVNVALTTEQRPGERVTGMPLVDLNYGIGDRLQLKYEAAWLRLDDGTGRHDGLSNSLAGVKWRFFDAGEKGWSVSVYPQMEFNNPGSHSDERGLAHHGTSFVLPFQGRKDFSGIECNADFGCVRHQDGSHEWFGGVLVGRELSHEVGVAVELHFEADAPLHDTTMTVNAGLHIGLSDKLALLASLGRELRHGIGPRATFVSYVGLQTCF